MLYAYFNGENPPSITSSSTTVDGENVFDITYSPFAFAFRKNDAVITEWADAFQAEMYLSTSSGEKEEGAKPFKMVTCDTVFPNNPNFAKHMCI